MRPYAGWDATALLARHAEYCGEHELTRDADKDARLMMFYEAALTEPEFVESLETPGAVRDTVIAFLFYAFVATAHTERASHVLAGLTFGRGFAARRGEFVAEWDRACGTEFDAHEESRLASVGVDDASYGPLSLKAMSYPRSTQFTELLVCFLRGSAYERNAWFDRLFASLNHYATCFTSCVKEVHATAFLHESKCAMWETFGRLYTHARLLETSVASVPEAFLDWENSAALLGRLVEALDFILRTSEHLEEWKSLVAAERRSLVSPKFLYCAVFGVVTCDARLEESIIKRLYKTSGITPNFECLLQGKFFESTPEYGCLDARVRALRESVRLAMDRISKIPKERDLSRDAPEEFLDALTGSVMENPVHLVASNQYVDLLTLDRLANGRGGGGIDPFTGTSIDAAMCKVDDELKRRISAWCDTFKESRPD